MSRLKDSFQRTIDYMRISITDRCNLRCIYCMPPEGLAPIEHKQILSYEEIVRILRVAVNIGVRKIRITGGEPLVRRNVSYLIATIKNIEGIKDLSLTTNGVLLEEFAKITLKAPYQVRFIEFMPFDTNRWSREKFIPADEIKSVVESLGLLT